MVELYRTLNHDWTETKEFEEGPWDTRVLFGKHSMGLNGFWIQGCVLYTHVGHTLFQRELSTAEMAQLEQQFNKTEPAR